MSVTDGMGNPNRGHALAVDRVRHTYGQGQATFEALGEISFEVPAGSVACIVGESGCGKSTLMRIMAGLDDAYNGEALLKRGAKEKPPSRKFFGDTAEHPWNPVGLGNRDGRILDGAARRRGPGPGNGHHRQLRRRPVQFCLPLFHRPPTGRGGA